MSQSRARRGRAVHHLKRGSIAAAVAAVAAAGLGAAPAQSATDASCPSAYPVDSLTQGQAVTGLTVSSGTTPDPFTGKVLGVLDDGIAPGIPMIVVRLSNPEIDRVGGIWEGMSGSPVYAADGSLIGAVSYGLSLGPSTVAGVTPAADMQKLLDTTPAAGTTGQPGSTVALPRAMQQRIVSTDAATPAEADSGMSQLKTPVAVTGLSSRRIKQVSNLFSNDGLRLVKAGATSSTSTADATGSIVPGGNLAAALSYGDVTWAGVGTATAVCGNEVLAFGHPMDWTGPASLSMHAADALYVQEDPTLAPFKLANIDVPPVGIINQDRMAGLHGLLGAPVPTADVTSDVTVGDQSRTGTTHIAEADEVPDLATTHLLADQDRVFDGYGKGSGTVGWTIDGTREDGSPFTLTRSDVYADPYDLTFASAYDLYDTLSRIQNNSDEDVTITSVKTTSDLSRDYKHYAMHDVLIREGGAWKSLAHHRPILWAQGTTKQIQVQLISRALGPVTVTLAVKMPANTAGRAGRLQVFGGNQGGYYDCCYYFEDGGYGLSNNPPTLDTVLSRIETAPHNDDVVAKLNLGKAKGKPAKTVTTTDSTGTVVDGSLYVSVRSVK